MTLFVLFVLLNKRCLAPWLKSKEMILVMWLPHMCARLPLFKLVLFAILAKLILFKSNSYIHKGSSQSPQSIYRQVIQAHEDFIRVIYATTSFFINCTIYQLTLGCPHLLIALTEHLDTRKRKNKASYIPTFLHIYTVSILYVQSSVPTCPYLT